VYEPGSHGNPAVTPNTWQRWNPLDLNAKWWVTRSTICGQLTPGCTWAEIQVKFVTTNTITGGVWLKAGSNWLPNKYNVDAFLFVATAPLSGVLYDFEPATNDD
jgi:hypothetical protein